MFSHLLRYYYRNFGSKSESNEGRYSRNLTQYESIFIPFIDS